MNNSDLQYLKKKYGENFAKLCRGLFPTILEQEGELSKLISENFAESKFLYEDIVNNNLENSFKQYIYSKFNPAKNEDEIEVEDPFTLMKKAGYTLYKCETDQDVKSFRKYWQQNEELCTFRDDDRINRNLIFFAVKDNVDIIKRESFKNPLRQDEYGTSVIGLQFTKTNPSTLSIKNRYNHVVENPDATFSNDLENIIAGLTKSFVKEYNLNLIATQQGFEILGYVLANDNKFYKYNYEINNTYYCENNIIIDGNCQIHEYDKNEYLVLDYFVLDLENNQIEIFDKTINDSFIDGLKDIKKIQVHKDNENKIIEITPKTGENVYITIDKMNKIIKYCDANLQQVGDYFLFCNKGLISFEAPKLKQFENWLLYNKNKVKEISSSDKNNELNV